MACCNIYVCMQLLGIGLVPLGDKTNPAGKSVPSLPETAYLSILLQKEPTWNQADLRWPLATLMTLDLRFPCKALEP